MNASHPSSELTAPDIRQHLARIEGERPGYAQLLDNIIVERDPFLFFRSFVGYFYDVAWRDEELLPGMATELRDASGWCAGDPHLGNFGTLIDVHGRARLTIVDPDDAGFCPLILDSLRFFSSLYLLFPDLADEQFHDIVTAYRAVLGGRAVQWSKAGKAKLARSEEQGMRFATKAVSEGKLTIPKRDDRGFLAVPPATKAQLAAALRDRLGPRTELLDVLQIDKHVGGSAGRLRYRVLLVPEIKAPLPGNLKRPALQAGASSPWIFDLKEIAAPATRFALLGELWPPKEAMTRSLDTMVGGSSPFYGVVSTLDKDFALRPRWLGNEAFETDDPEALSLATDAAQALAVWHLSGANQPASYATALARVSPKELRRWSRALADRMRDDFAALCGKPVTEPSHHAPKS